MTLFRRTGPLFAALAVTLIAAGCAATPTEPIASSTPAPVVTPSATPTVPAVDPSIPTALLDVSCEELVPDATSAIDADISATNPHESVRGAGVDLPYTFALERLGGLACQWSNGEFYNPNQGGNDDYRGVRLAILPTTKKDAESYGYPTSGKIDDALDCSEYDGYQICGGGVLVDGQWWLAIEADGVVGADEETATAGFTDLLATAKTAVETASELPAWIPPAGTLPIGPKCPDIISNKKIGSALSVEETIGNSADTGSGDSYGIYAAARVQLDAQRCFWTTDDAYIGSALWIPAGEWAWTESMTFDSVSGGLEELDVTDGEAWLACRDAGTDNSGGCTLDVIVGHNWIEADFSVGEDGVDADASTTEAYTTVAQAMIDKVTAG